MMCLIKSRTDQIRHPGIEYGKFLVYPLLHIQHFRDKRATLPHHSASQFKVQSLVRPQLQLSGIRREITLEIRNRLTVGVIIINAQSTTYIDMFHKYLTRLKPVLQLVHTIAKGYEVSHIQYLRTDMEMQADEIDILHLLRHVDHLIHIFHADAKLILCQSGSNIRMGMRPHIRIDTESDIGHFAFRGSQFVDDLQFGDRLYIETENVVIQTEFNLPIRFAYTGKNNLLCRETGFHRRTNFTATHTIGSHATLTDYGKYLRIGIRLYSIMHVKTFVTGNFFIDGIQRIAQNFRIIVIKRSTQLTKLINREYSFHKKTLCLASSTEKTEGTEFLF